MDVPSSSFLGKVCLMWDEKKKNENEAGVMQPDYLGTILRMYSVFVLMQVVQ